MTARLVVVLTVLAVAGCGSSSPAPPSGADVSPPGDIPDNQVFVRYAPSGAPFSVEVPEGWARSGSGHDVRFTDNLNAIEIVWDRSAAPTPAQAKVSSVPRSAGTARRSVYLAGGRTDAVTGKRRTDAVERYEFTHAGHRVVLILSGPRGADNVDPWRIVTDSLRWR